MSKENSPEVINEKDELQRNKQNQSGSFNPQRNLAIPMSVEEIAKMQVLEAENKKLNENVQANVNLEEDISRKLDEIHQVENDKAAIREMSLTNQVNWKEHMGANQEESKQLRKGIEENITGSLDTLKDMEGRHWTMTEEQTRTIKSLKVKNAKQEGDISNKEAVIKGVGEEIEILKAITQQTDTINERVRGSQEELRSNFQSQKDAWTREKAELTDRIKTYTVQKEEASQNANNLDKMVQNINSENKKLREDIIKTNDEQNKVRTRWIDAKEENARLTTQAEHNQMTLTELKHEIDNSKRERDWQKGQADTVARQLKESTDEVNTLTTENASVMEEMRKNEAAVTSRQVELNQLKENIHDLLENEKTQKMYIGKLEEERDDWQRKGDTKGKEGVLLQLRLNELLARDGGLTASQEKLAEQNAKEAEKYREISKTSTLAQHEAQDNQNVAEWVVADERLVQKAQNLEKLNSLHAQEVERGDILRNKIASLEGDANEANRQKTLMTELSEEKNKLASSRDQSFTDNRMYKGELHRSRVVNAELEKASDQMKNLLAAQEEEVTRLRAENKVIPELRTQQNELTERVARLHAQVEGLSYIPQPIEKPKTKQKAAKGDAIDEMLQDFVNQNELPIGFQRISEGLQWFGTRKVNIKILNGRLVVRVGGGQMYIIEFVEQQTTQELDRLKGGSANQMNAEAKAHVMADRERKSTKMAIGDGLKGMFKMGGEAQNSRSSLSKSPDKI